MTVDEADKLFKERQKEQSKKVDEKRNADPIKKAARKGNQTAYNRRVRGKDRKFFLLLKNFNINTTSITNHIDFQRITSRRDQQKLGSLNCMHNSSDEWKTIIEIGTIFQCLSRKPPMFANSML